MIEEQTVQLQQCMYQYSRAIYRSIKDMVDPYADRHHQLESRRAVLVACEQTMERLASDPLYFAKPERALFQDWGISLFYDTGNAFDSSKSFRLYQGVGLGVHYYTRVGALNFSLARQVGVDEPNFHLHFTVGLEL